jgi:carbon storage regulator
MLILCRKVGERIVIGNHTTITVLTVGVTQTRLGISAPAEVRVRRAEVANQPRRRSKRAGVNGRPAEPVAAPVQP